MRLSKYDYLFLSSNPISLQKLKDKFGLLDLSQSKPITISNIEMAILPIEVNVHIGCGVIYYMISIQVGSGAFTENPCVVIVNAS